MRVLCAMILSFAAFQASAAIDCDIKTSVDKKITESKAEFGKPFEREQLTSYESIKDGYTFKVDLIRSKGNVDVQLNITEQGSNNRTVSSYEDVKINKKMMIAFGNDKLTPAKIAKLTCQLKP